MLRPRSIIGLLCGIIACMPSMLLAQEGLSISITPPLFQLAISPGDSWASSIKVVNNNPQEVAYYAQVVDFQAQGEGGQSSFIPLLDGERELGVTLASWISIPAEPLVIPRGKSGEVPFTIRIPEDAPPGGHYAAILVGTKPPKGEIKGASVKIASFVSSLLFVKIKGEVEEHGRIREFRSTEELYQSPKADFVLRFENIGNTHLRPQGTITLYNMWGKERGSVAINQAGSSFGSVLPNSTRKYQFSWEGEQDIFDIGRYSAGVTLAFGEDGRQNVSAKTYFWIVPVVPVAYTLGSVVIFILLLVWLIRRYIRRAISLEQMHHGSVADTHAQTFSTLDTFIEPLREGVVDLRRVASRPEMSPASALMELHVTTVAQLLSKYALFLLFVVVIAIGCFGLTRYMRHSLTPERRFQVSDVKIEEVPLLLD